MDHVPEFLDDLEIQQEEESKLSGKKPAVEASYRWRDWASKSHGKEQFRNKVNQLQSLLYAA